MINFAKGHPNLGLLPLKGIKEAMTKTAAAAAVQQESNNSNNNKLVRSLNYPKVDNGDPELIEELASFLQRHTKDDDLGSIPSRIDNNHKNEDSPPSPLNNEEKQTVTPPSFFMTHGVSHGLEILCKAVTSPGDVVVIERPTYFLVKEIFLSHGLIVQSLPMKSP